MLHIGDVELISAANVNIGGGSDTPVLLYQFMTQEVNCGFDAVRRARARAGAARGRGSCWLIGSSRRARAGRRGRLRRVRRDCGRDIPVRPPSRATAPAHGALQCADRELLASRWAMTMDESENGAITWKLNEFMRHPIPKDRLSF